MFCDCIINLIWKFPAHVLSLHYLCDKICRSILLISLEACKSNILCTIYLRGVIDISCLYPVGMLGHLYLVCLLLSTIRFRFAETVLASFFSPFFAEPLVMRRSLLYLSLLNMFVHSQGPYSEEAYQVVKNRNLTEILEYTSIYERISSISRL